VLLKLTLSLSRLVLFLSIIGLCHTQSVWAQHSISGQILDEGGLSIEGVSVFIHETHQGAATDSNGAYSIKNIKTGHYHLHITCGGYHSEQQDILVDGDIIHLNFVLGESVNELHQVVIEGSLDKSTLKNNPLQVVHLDNHYLKQQGGTSFMKNLEKIPGIGSLSNGVGVSKPVIPPPIEICEKYIVGYFYKIF